MATVDDVEVANASFPNVRQDLNDILEALATNFSADAEPTTTYPNQFWYETDTNLLYIRNEADDAWITLASINQTSGEWEPRTAVIQAVDSAGLALKTDEGTTRVSISDAGVVSFENYAFPSADGSANQVLATDGSGTLSFIDSSGDKIEEGNSSVEVVDTGTGHVAVTVDGVEVARFDANGRLGIGTTSPSGKLDIVTGTTGNVLIDAEGGSNFHAKVVNDSGDLYLGARNASADTYITSQRKTVFKTGSSETEAARIDSSGDVLIGTTAMPGTTNTGGAGFDNVSNDRNILKLGHDADSSTKRALAVFYYKNAPVGSIESSNSSTNFATTSDYRLKENVVDMTGAITRVKALNPSRFNFIADPDTTVDGFLAHEAQEIVPEAVTGEKDEVEAIGNVTDAEGVVVQEGVTEPTELPEGQTWTKTGERPVMQGIDQAKLVPLLTGALQEAIAKIEALEARVSALES